MDPTCIARDCNIGRVGDLGDSLSVMFLTGPDGIVHEDVKGAQPGLGRLSRCLKRSPQSQSQ